MSNESSARTEPKRSTRVVSERPWGKNFDIIAEKETKEISASGRPGMTRRGSICKIVSDISEKLSLNESDSLLDLGCGTGLLSREWSQGVRFLAGLDAGEQVLKRSLRERHSLSGQPVLIQGEITNLPLRREQFDKLLCYSVVQYLPSYAEFKRVLIEMLRVLRPGGLALIGDIPEHNLRAAWAKGLRGNDESLLHYLVRRSREKATQLTYNLGAKLDSMRKTKQGIQLSAAPYMTYDSQTILEIVKEIGATGQILEQPSGLPFNHTRIDLLLRK